MVAELLADTEVELVEEAKLESPPLRAGRPLGADDRAKEVKERKVEPREEAS